MFVIMVKKLRSPWLVPLLLGFAVVTGACCLARPAAATDSFRCGTDLVCIGDSEAEVLLKCGEPYFVKETGVKGRSRTVRSSRVSKSRADDDTPTRKRERSSAPKRTVYRETVSEVWTYNRGPNDFIYNLYFEGGVLKRIKTGGRGR